MINQLTDGRARCFSSSAVYCMYHVPPSVKRSVSHPRLSTMHMPALFLGTWATVLAVSPTHPPTCVCSGSATASRSTWRAPVAPCLGWPRSSSSPPARSRGKGRASSRRGGKVAVAGVSDRTPPGAGIRRRRRRCHHRHPFRFLLSIEAACSRCSLSLPLLMLVELPRFS